MNVKALFESVSEHPDPLTISLEGKLPDWFRGTYYAVGNGLWDLPSGFTVRHVYDGYAILYSFRIMSGNQIIVRSKYLESDSYKKAMSKGKPVASEFGTIGSTDPNKGIFNRMLSQVLPVNLTDNDFLNLTLVQGKLFAISETCFIHEINLETLKSMQKVDLFKTLGCAYISPIPIHLTDGTTYWIGHSIGAGLKSNVIQFPPTSSNKEKGNNDKDDKGTDACLKSANFLASVSSRWKLCFSYMHSFALTKSYFILVDQPLLINNLKLLTSQIQQKTIREIFDWQPQEKFILILINRSTGQVLKTKYTASPMFIVHCINAYEEDGHILFDVLGRNSDEILDLLLLSTLRENKFIHDDPPQVYRFVLPIINKITEVSPKENLVTLKGSKAKAEKINDSIFCTPEALGKPGFDYPAINKSFIGKKYRYVYGTGYFEEGYYRRSICKMDMKTEEVTLLKVEDSQYLCEPLFIPRPNALTEDDGIIVTSMIDTRPDYPSAIIFVDGKSFQEIERTKIPYRTAYTQHGLFIKTEQLENDQWNN